MIKCYTVLLTFFIISSLVKVNAQSDWSFDVMTYNIKYDDKKDSINGWSARKADVIGLINYHDPELFGTQEGLKNQLDDIKSGLEGYAYIGIGRDGGVGQGEYSAIFYDQQVFELKDSGTFWLSENPHQPGKSWDAAFPRICTWGRFAYKATGQIILYFNTHFDHVGVTARAESAKLILQAIKKQKEESDATKIILTGDFNFTPDAAPYQLITKEFADTFS
ncbi:endonuclease/exonuclease/phosphatase family protein, partial [Fulvivirga sp. RKSG066]|uniref:endonuclease/exonuclease/phosphatase family protein n=1 Tax=Fulvivirga aurantia TaxID=2529383 RepID=UPI0012BD4094